MTLFFGACLGGTHRAFGDVGVDPMNDNLRDDLRFADLLRKAGLGP